MRANRCLLLVAMIGLVGFGSRVGAQSTDSIRTYWVAPVEVKGQRIYVGGQRFPLEKDNLSNVLGKNGFKLIRKGVFFAQDIYADGMKRGDINVVVDGERYHSACPNRMDSPLTRVNPLELESVELMKTGGSVQSGLGGLVHFQRRRPDRPALLTGGASASGASKRAMDAVAAAEGRHHRVSIRHSQGDPYTDADDRTFKELYNYKDNFSYRLTEGNLIGELGRLVYGANIAITEDVSFPYLQMDERTNEVYNGSAGFGTNKAYFNHTDHLMDNDLRTSGMLMETKATNLTVGVVGNLYEIYYRNWDANNQFFMPADTITNKMIPDTRTVSAALHKAVEVKRFTFSGKIGGVYQSVGDKNRMGYYESLHPDASSDRWFAIYAVSGIYARAIGSSWVGALMVESASESPETETLYIAVRKPMGKPWWSGNPNLDQPLRATLRSSIRYRPVQLELFGTYVWNYVYLTSARVGTTNYMTYENIDAALLGLNLNADWTYLDIHANYAWAQNRTNDTPLAEIAPLALSARVKSPRYYGFDGFVDYTYNANQKRIDESLDERPTPSWNRFDVGVNYAYSGLLVTLEVDNITSELYYQHLSYLRNPFASGASVWEPGTAVTLGVRVTI